MFRISQGIENVDSSAFKRGTAGSARASSKAVI
jgi:hypothetical protein